MATATKTSTNGKDTRRLIMGNEAVALGAIAAGCDFYAGYPITPATEILEEMARLLPRRGGVFLQMEDELSAMAAIIGAAWGGATAMTATSGPGFSLMQENLGYAAITQTPCVIVDSQRGGPSTGLPTLPSQGDAMQARFGTHGDRPALVITASSVRGCYDATVLAFKLAKRHRMPVVLLFDAVISHMREPVEIPPPPPPPVRNFPALAEGDPRFGDAPFVPFGYGPIAVVTGLSHGGDGLAETRRGVQTEAMIIDSISKLDQDPEIRAEWTGDYRLDDADVAIVAYGITARAAREAVDQLRERGVAAGLLDLRILWPFAHQRLREVAAKSKTIVVPELNLGQMVMPVRAAVEGAAKVYQLNRADGTLLTPEDIAAFAISVQGGQDA
ncbi:MAG: 2-oxoacid:acceptor oxidoreductase subunit alpha [Actinomycetota bacterium]|nr:2-oxoacid:acceptor oxidoreductase subunit alpha [Actinomycetota bacterium]